jgi:meso-butanediol dehydrogenase / (S,S)-butanediol dehydrogenase / diacetyl reductase
VAGRLEGRGVVVTAAGSGIGRACALRYAAEGAGVVVNALHQETAAAVTEQILAAGGQAITRAGDVGDRALVDELVDTALAEYGRLDVMHNNAAHPKGALVADMSDEDWAAVMRVTLDGVFYGTRAALRVMVPQRRGSIINTTSSSGLSGARMLGAYGAAKAGVAQLTRVAALENAQYGVRVNAVCPGVIETRPSMAFIDAYPGGRPVYEAQIPQRRVGQPEELANVALFLASDEASYVNGAEFVVDGGVAARIALPLNLPAVGVRIVTEGTG